MKTTGIKEKYEKAVLPELKKELGHDNKNALPKLLKVSVSVGIGSMVTGGNKDYSAIEESLRGLTGQKPSVRKARKAISNFKLREGLPVGLLVTLRGNRMYDFVERLVNVALPRVRDFQGITVKGLDGQGNYCLGLKDSSIFPTSNNVENLNRVHGMQINICTTAKNNREAYVLLKGLGFPFKDSVNA